MWCNVDCVLAITVASVVIFSILMAAGWRANFFTCTFSLFLVLSIYLSQCWGKNTKGNLGIDDIHDRGDDEDELGDNLPFTLLSVPVWSLDAGDDHTCALLVDATVKVRIYQVSTQRKNREGKTGAGGDGGGVLLFCML